jgi:hypothetical protein
MEVPVGESSGRKSSGIRAERSAGKVWIIAPVNTNPPKNVRPAAEPAVVMKLSVSDDGRV